MYIGALTSKPSSKQKSKPDEETNKGTLILKKLHATEDLVQQKHSESAEWYNGEAETDHASGDSAI